MCPAMFLDFLAQGFNNRRLSAQPLLAFLISEASFLRGTFEMFGLNEIIFFIGTRFGWHLDV